MLENKQIKKFAYKAGILTLIGSAVIINEQLLRNRIEKQQQKFAQEKSILQHKISELEKKEKQHQLASTTSFRFYKHLPNGIDYKEFEAIDTLSFHNHKENTYAQYRPVELTKELIEGNDSLSSSPKSYNEILNEQEQYYQSMNDSCGIDSLLKNGQLFLHSLLTTMSQYNHAMNGNLSKIIEQSDEQNDREFKARALMFKVKTKNKMYENRHSLNADFYRLVFLKNVSVYRRTANMLTQIVDSLDNQYKKEIKQDSIAFENDKSRHIDSILSSKPKNNYIKPYPFSTLFPQWNHDH